MKDFDLGVPVLDGSKIKWVAGGYCKSIGTADASDLGLRAGQSPVGRCYEDACDVGCIVVNNKRQTAMKFVVDHIEVDVESGLQFWSLTNCESHPSKRILLKIYND